MSVSLEQFIADAKVTLREITRETVKAVLDLRVAHAKKGFVASNARSIAEAYFLEDAWFRAIDANETYASHPLKDLWPTFRPPPTEQEPDRVPCQILKVLGRPSNVSTTIFCAA